MIYLCVLRFLLTFVFCDAAESQCPPLAKVGLLFRNQWNSYGGGSPSAPRSSSKGRTRTSLCPLLCVIVPIWTPILHLLLSFPHLSVHSCPPYRPPCCPRDSHSHPEGARLANRYSNQAFRVKPGQSETDSCHPCPVINYPSFPGAPCVTKQLTKLDPNSLNWCLFRIFVSLGQRAVPSQLTYWWGRFMCCVGHSSDLCGVAHIFETNVHSSTTRISAVDLRD